VLRSSFGCGQGRAVLQFPSFFVLREESRGEIYYTLWRGRGVRAANEVMERVAQLPIQVVDVDAKSAKTAATIKR
jgi:hypothetical protein